MASCWASVVWDGVVVVADMNRFDLSAQELYQQSRDSFYSPATFPWLFQEREQKGDKKTLKGKMVVLKQPKHPGGSEMEYSTFEQGREIGESGIKSEIGSLYDRFHEISDPRKAKGKMYSLVTLLVVIFLGKLCGKDKPGEIADWAQNQAEELGELLGLKNKRMPSHSTIRRVFQYIVDENELSQMAREYSQYKLGGAGEVLAIDGKTLRGTRVAGQEASDHVLSVYDVAHQQVIAQVTVDSKENEIVAAPQVLEMVSVAGKVVTGDAMHTQRALSAQIVAQGGHYLWPVKDNQPQLYQAIECLFAPQEPKPGFGKIPDDFLTASTVNRGHGRIEKRVIHTSAMLNDYLDWPALGQVYRLERQFNWVRRGEIYKTSSEVELGITSLPTGQASPAQVLQFRRSHWHIETTLHYSRDVTFHEDATRMTIGPAGRILAIIHNLIIALLKRLGYNNVAQARRYYEGHLSHAFHLLITANALS
jgi:predicted transposase YbfD/YdcC